MVVAFSIFSFVSTFNDWYFSIGTFEYHIRCLICSFVILSIGIGIIYWEGIKQRNRTTNMRLQKGTLLQGDKYKIERVLGQGGFGITYLATQKISVQGPLGTIDTQILVTIKEFFMKDFCNRNNNDSIVSVPSVGSKELVEKFRQKFKKEAININLSMEHFYILTENIHSCMIH